MANTKLIDSTVMISRGRENEPTSIRFRDIGETAPLTGRTIVIDRFINVMLDKRAPGLWAGVVGGPKTKIEHLAELAVTHGVVGQIADDLLDAELVRRINDKLIRSNQRFKSGVLTMDQVSLLRAVSAAIGASTAATDPKRHVARVITELLSRAYTQLNVMVPFVGAVELEYHSTPVADTDTLIKAAQVATVAEVFEAIELGGAFKDAKEFNPTIAETLLGPLLVSAANRLMNSLRYEMYMRDTAILVGRYITKAGNLPDHVRDNPDLAYLASNASFALGALGRTDEPIRTPDFDLREAITYTVMRLRELRRFETVSIDRFREMYTHELVKAPSGYIAGVYVQRNDTLSLRAQVSKFVDRTEYTAQCPVEVGEAYLAPLSEAVQRAFEGSVLQRTTSVAAQHLITVDWENDDSGNGGRAFLNGVTPAEELLYGMAHADRLYVTDLASNPDAEGTPGQPRLIMEVADGKVFYQAKGQYTGAAVTTDDPAEILILKGADAIGSTPFPTRPQTIMDDMRKALLPALPIDLVVDLAKPVRVVLPELDGTQLELEVSLQQLLGLTEIGTLYLTVEGEARRQITDSFAALVAVYNELRGYADETAPRLLARQVATAAHALIGRIAAGESFNRFLNTLFVMFMQDAQFKGRKHMLRAHLSSAYVQHQLVLSASMLILLKLGLVPFGLHEDLAEMFASQDVVEIAVTSEAWERAMRPRN